MDILCEQSLFNTRRGVGNRRVHVYPYKKILNSPLKNERLRLVELHWDMHESIKPDFVDTPQKLKDVQISAIRAETRCPGEFGEVDSFVKKSESVRINDDDQPTNDYLANSLPEGIGKAHNHGYKTKRYKCHYCPQVGRVPRYRTLQRALLHRAHCNHNPHRVQHYNEFLSKPLFRQFNSARPSYASRKSKSSIKCWVVVDGNKYSCRECMDHGEELKIWKCKTSVKRHCAAKCKYRDISTACEPMFVDNEEISNHKKCAGQSQHEPRKSKWGDMGINESQDGKMKLEGMDSCVKPKYQNPRIAEYQHSPINSHKFDKRSHWFQLDRCRWICRACLENKEPIKTWSSEACVRTHWRTNCKYNDRIDPFGKHVLSPLRKKSIRENHSNPKMNRLKVRSGFGMF